MHTAIDMNGNNLDNAGDIKGKQAIISGGISGQSATISGEIKGQQATISGDIKSTGGWITTQGNKGWMNETHGGGFYMSDSSWIRSLNNKGIYTAGEIRGGQLRSDGDASVAGILKLEKINVADTSCPTNGAVSRTATGAPLSCQSGLWRSGGKVSSFEMVQGNDACGKYVYSKAYCPAGKQLISGGFILSNWTGGNGWNAPDLSMPSASETPGRLLPEVALQVEHVCVQLRGALKIDHVKIMGTIPTNKSWKLLTMFTYLFSTLRNKLKVSTARTLFNTQNLRRKSRNKLLIKSGVVIKGESAVTPPFL